MTLDQLRGLDGAAAAEAAWAKAAWAARGPAAAPGSDCDAVIVPVVSGHVDPAVLGQLTAALLSHDPAPRSFLSPYGPRSPKAAAVRRVILRHAADLLSRQAGLAAFLRTGLLDGAAGT